MCYWLCTGKCGKKFTYEPGGVDENGEDIGFLCNDCKPKEYTVCSRKPPVNAEDIRFTGIINGEDYFGDEDCEDCHEKEKQIDR